MSDERIQRVIAEINTYIDAEKRNAGPNIGTVPQSKEDACRAARIAAFVAVLYLLEALAPLEGYGDGQPYRERSWETETRLEEEES